MTKLVRALIACATIAVTAMIVPRWWCGRDASLWLEADEETERALADVVARTALAGVEPSDLHTGSEHFDGEWALVTNQMTVLGLGQIVLRKPKLREVYLPAMRAAARAMITPEALAFGTHAWGERGLDTLVLAGERGHVYLGYAALALGMLRAVEQGAMERDLALVHDRLIDALARRLSRSPHGLIETFPGVTFPADVASAVGAIGLHDRVTGGDHRELLARWSATFRAHYVHRGSGFVFQTADPRSGKTTGAPRGSGTALEIYFLSFADRALARELYEAIARGGVETFLGFGGVREYPRSVRQGRGDIDSGPVVFGVSVAATGFAMSGARMFGDEETFRALFRTAHLFGAPEDGGYLVGRGLGDAILLAMMTAEVSL